MFGDYFDAPVFSHALRFALRCRSILSLGIPCTATVFGNIRGVVHDPQHHPVSGAQATLQANDSAYKTSAATDANGEFHFDAVPLGTYTISVDATGFAPQSQVLVVVSGSAPVLHYQLAVATAKQEVTVTASPEDLNPDSPRRDILISQEQISRYAGVDASNSFKIITEFVPGSYMVHDQLHVRGGHQVTWAIDGVPIPNTNIASNVGPAVQSQGCLVPAGGNRQLCCRIRRPHLRRLQRRAQYRFRAQSPGRTHRQLW